MFCIVFFFSSVWLVSSEFGPFVDRRCFTDEHCGEYYYPFGRQFYKLDSCVPYGVDAAHITVDRSKQTMLFKFCEYGCEKCNDNSTYLFNQCIDESYENSIIYEDLEKWPEDDKWTANLIFNTKEECEKPDPNNLQRGTIYSDYCTNFYANERVRCYENEVYHFYYADEDVNCTGKVVRKEKSDNKDCLEDIGGYSIFRCASFIKNL